MEQRGLSNSDFSCLEYQAPTSIYKMSKATYVKDICRSCRVGRVGAAG